jgi:hypothetical protein
MQEWILKFITAITTAKTAFILLFTVVLIVFGWNMTLPFFIEKGVPNDMAPFLLTLTSFSIAVIALDIVYKVYGAINKWRKYWIDTYNQKREQVRQQEIAKITKYEETRRFRNKVDLTFPYLDKPSQKLLHRLFERGNDALVWSKNPTFDLHHKGFIIHIGEASGNQRLYELAPIVREYLAPRISKKKVEDLTAFSKDLDGNSREFLRVFFDEIIPFGIPEQEKMMDALVYHSMHRMVLIKAIEQIDYIFILSSEFKEQLIRDGHFKTCYRIEVTLDSANILAL